MARGNTAKEEIAKKIIECFGRENVIEADKKLYINTKEDGSPIQVCISMTCPKVPIGQPATSTAAPAPSAFSGGLDFENMGAVSTTPEPFKPAEITDKERETVLELMARLGL